ncbi:hypothetical protein SOVF_028690 [Spinacia oleracea]|nr:hypothetical protein SOVF_028690 [Spinacia oleracea]
MSLRQRIGADGPSAPRGPAEPGAPEDDDAEKVPSGPHRGIFERGGAGCCGSGGGQGLVADGIFNAIIGGYSSHGQGGFANRKFGERQGGFDGGFTGRGQGGFPGGRLSGGSDIFVGRPMGELFERDGAVGSGSGGNSGSSAGKSKFGGGTTPCGVVNKVGDGFVKGRSEASGSGGGPGHFLGISTGDGSYLLSGDIFNGVVGRRSWSFQLQNFLAMVCGRSPREYSFGLRKKTNSKYVIEGNYVFVQIVESVIHWLRPCDRPCDLEERGEKVLEAIKVNVVKDQSNDVSREFRLLESHVLS